MSLFLTFDFLSFSLQLSGAWMPDMSVLLLLRSLEVYSSWPGGKSFLICSEMDNAMACELSVSECFIMVLSSL